MQPLDSTAISGSRTLQSLFWVEEGKAQSEEVSKAPVSGLAPFQAGKPKGQSFAIRSSGPQGENGGTLSPSGVEAEERLGTLLMVGGEKHFHRRLRGILNQD